MREIDIHCAPDARGAELLKEAIGCLGLSARGPTIAPMTRIAVSENGTIPPQ